MKLKALVLACASIFLGACSSEAQNSNAASSVMTAAAIAPANIATAQRPQAQPNYSAPDIEYETLDNDQRKAAMQVALHYCAISPKPVPYDDLARLKSDDFAKVTDQFQQHDLLATLKPQFDQAMAQARQHRYLRWHGKATLGSYDFGRKSFTVVSGLYPMLDTRSLPVPIALLGIADNTAGNEFQITDEALARQIEAKRASMPYSAGSPFGMNVFAYVQQADGPHFSPPGHGELTVVVTKMQLTDGDGGPVIAEVKATP